MRNKAGNYTGKRRQFTTIIKKKAIPWIVVANHLKAVFYSKDDGELTFKKRLSNPLALKTEGMLDSDRPGTGYSSAGRGSIRHSLDRTFHRREQVTKAFARLIAHTLLKDHRARHFNELTIIAEPRFLGILRATLSARMKALVKFEVNREFLKGSDVTLRNWINIEMDRRRHLV